MFVYHFKSVNKQVAIKTEGALSVCNGWSSLSLLWHSSAKWYDIGNISGPLWQGKVQSGRQAEDSKNISFCSAANCYPMQM